MQPKSSNQVAYGGTAFKLIRKLDLNCRIEKFNFYIVFIIYFLN